MSYPNLRQDLTIGTHVNFRMRRNPGTTRCLMG